MNQGPNRSSGNHFLMHTIFGVFISLLVVLAVNPQIPIEIVIGLLAVAFLAIIGLGLWAYRLSKLVQRAELHQTDSEGAE